MTTAGRVLAMGFMLSNFVILATYTAALAAHLTIQRMPEATITGMESIGAPGSGKPIEYHEVCLATIGGSVEGFWTKTWGEARRDSAEHFSRLDALLFTATVWIFIPAYCFAVP